MSFPFRLRPAAESDLGFILSTWLNGATEAWDTAKRTDVSAWSSTGIRVGHFADLTRRFTRDAVTSILQRPDCRAVVACDVEDDDVIYGYAVAEPGARIVHWVCVKHQFKRRGIAHDMVASLVPDAERGVVCTYLPSGFVAMQSKWPVRFDPHAGK
jgi:hypothetical protein